jgi:hypothetical protein
MRVLDFNDGFTSVGAPSDASQWGAPDGSLGAPGMSWSNDADTGRYRPSANTMDDVCNGNRILRIDTSGIRVLTTAATYETLERVSVLNDPATGDAATNQCAVQVAHYNQRDTAFSARQTSVYATWTRVTTVDITDSGGPCAAMRAAMIFSTASGKTYTNSGLVTAIIVPQPSQAGPGSLALTDYAGMYIQSSSLNTGTRKYGIYVGQQTGATYNAVIADAAVSDNYALYLSSTYKSFIGGPVGVEGGVSTDTMFRVRGNSQTSGANQYGFYVDTIFSSSGTTSGYGITSVPQTAAASFTMGNLFNFIAGAPTIGAGSTVTRHVDYYTQLGTGGTHDAVLADNTTFSGDWFINSTSTRASLFSGIVQFAAGLRTIVSTANTANPPTDAELDSAFGAPATLGTGFVGILNDNNGGTNEYLCWADGTNWFYATGTKAT